MRAERALAAEQARRAAEAKLSEEVAARKAAEAALEEMQAVLRARTSNEDEAEECEEDGEAALAARDDPTAVHAGTFATVEKFARWLERHGVDTSSWGQSKAKSVADLLAELEAMESTLEVRADGSVARVLSVVNVVVRNANSRLRHLACYESTTADGRVRARKRGKQLPSHKMTAGEAAGPAAVRCLVEELGGMIDERDVSIIEGSLIVWDTLDLSRSYPGLACKYRLHQVEATASRLPSTRFDSAKGAQAKQCFRCARDRGRSHRAHTHLLSLHVHVHVHVYVYV
jgi:hypothetical protein